MSAPIEEPLSWFTLERYALGELDDEATRQVERRLQQSAEDRACLDAILQDDSELPPLPIPLGRPGPRPGRALSRPSYWALSTALAAAAAMLLVLLRDDAPALKAIRHVESGEKGGDVALVLTSDREGQNPETFAPGERFKVLVTAPTWFEEPLRVVVFQGGERYTPLAQGEPLPHGNLVPWPGAFALDGDEAAEVCVSWSEREPQATRAEELGDEAVCIQLRPR